MPVWRVLRDKYAEENFELITVGFDVLGAEGCREFIEAAAPTHPALIDEHHVLSNLYGFVNIPQAIWIDENFNLVRPVEGAPPPPGGEIPTPPPPTGDIPSRMIEMMTEASKIVADPEVYHAALADWIEKGAESQYVLTADQIVERSEPRDFNKALGHAHFELACELEKQGQHELAIKHFRTSHELVPDSWTFRRQAWSLEKVGDGPLARFWQGPSPDAPDDWPYEGDWVKDIREVGAENYYKPFDT